MAPRKSQPLQFRSFYQKNHSPFPTAAQEDQRYHHHHHSTVDAANVLASEWMYDPTFGIIHNEDCSICQSYKTHLFAANLSNEASFENAFSAREERVTSAFSDGVQAGRQLQQEDDRLQLACCREERDNALRNLNQQMKLLEATRKEMEAFRNQVVATVDELSKKINDVVTEAHAGTLLGSGADVSRINTNYPDALPAMSPSISLSSWSDHHVLPTVPDSPIADKKAKNASFATPPFAETLDETDVSDANTSQAHNNVLSLMMASEIMTARPATSAKPSIPPLKPAASWQQLSSMPPKPLASQHPISFVPTRASDSSQCFTTLADLKAAMKAASAGDSSWLMKVRAFSALAQATPQRERTKRHRYVINNWSEPPLSVPASSAQTMLHDNMLSADAYVDASQWGIGFVMNGSWLAWKFADPTALPAVPGGQMDIRWAEMLAVEVGLWTMIHWVCYATQKEGDNLKSLKILVRSDNAGVVRAIEERQTNHPLLQDILQRILHMVSEFDIALTIKWIPGKENLADKMSRGVLGHIEDLLPLIPPLPPHLSDILNLFTEQVTL